MRDSGEIEPAKRKPGKILLVVNGEIVDEAEVRQEAERIRETFASSTDIPDAVTREIRLREAAQDSIVNGILLRQAAQSKTGGDVEGLLARLTKSAKRPPYAELRQYYQRHQADFWQPEGVRASHIVKNVEEPGEQRAILQTMQTIAARLAGGEDFASLADEVSDCRGEGGDLGWFPRGVMVPEFDAAVFDLKAGETSEIFQTVFGFHIARVMARRAEGWVSFEEARPRIHDFLFEQRKSWAVEQFLAELKNKARFERIDESLLQPKP